MDPKAGPGLAQGAAGEALKRYALIVESMTEGVSLATDDGTIVYTNPAEDEMFGYARGELVGLRVSVQNAYDPQENEARVGQVIETLKATGRWEGEWRNRRRDGSAFLTASRISAVELDGRTHFLCVQRDITAERAAEERLRESEERLHLAVEGTGVGIYDLDLATGEGFWSDSAFRMLGYEPTPDGRATWAMWNERLHPEDAPAVLAAHRAAEAGGVELSLEFRIVRADDGEVRWLSAFGRILPAEHGGRSIGTVLDTTERRRAEEHQRLLVNELNHRVKNTLAIIQGIAQQSFRGREVSPEARNAFEGRLAALSTAHNLLTQERWEAAGIGQVIADALGPLHGERVHLEGPDIRLPPKTAVALALAMHELATNAAKYGALSAAEGKVLICWGADGDTLGLVWSESGGPPVRPPASRGFGTRMIERALSSEFQGSARIDFRPQGVVCTLEARLPETS